MLAAALRPAAGQTVTLEPSAAVRCLTPTAEQRGAPEYPFDAWKREEKGRVVVELSFTSRDKRPAVKVLSSEGDGDSKESFVAAVRSHVANYRVPCLNEAAGLPAQLRLAFVFQPQERVVQNSGPQDADDQRRSELLKCVQHTSREKAPDYPMGALRAELQGRVLARLSFNAKDQAPQAQVLARPAAKQLADAVASFVKGLRMPCFDGGEAIDATFTFIFRLEGTGAFGFKPIGLVDLMPRVRGIQRQALNFDTTTMACPFDVRFQYRQPYMANVVSQIADSNAARSPLIRWLTDVHLELPARSLDSVFADDTVITVPCVKIELKPQETS